jgi:hypothetical protein
VIINEATDSTARFKLATKYNEMDMWDDEEGEWRVVVDVECPKSNPWYPLRKQDMLAFGM